jgi:leader peptidase (prepilin peptidase)/N-methyltransferase
MTVPEFLRAVASGEQSLAGWWFVALSALLGGVIGSFLNVVVYRLPRGMSLSHPGSHCPHCGHAIRWRDNVPVLGWLWLGGQCRDCRAGISARYPLVEGFVILMFAGFAWLEVASGGINLPHRTPLEGEDPAVLAWLRFAGHMLLTCTLLAAALMQRDGQPTPRRLWTPALALGFAATIWWPGIRPMALSEPFESSLPAPWMIGLGEGLCGLAVGVILGQLGFSSIKGQVRGVSSGNFSVPAILGVVGLFLGCQAACWVGVGSLLCWAAMSGRPATVRLNRSGAAAGSGPLAGVLVATLVVLLAWRGLATVQSQSHVRLEFGLALSAGAMFFGHMLLGRIITRPSARN